MGWEVQSQGSDPRAFRLPPWAAGATGRGPKVSSAAFRALGFGGQGHAVGRKGAARKSGAQVAALGRAHRKRRGGAAQHLSTLALGRDQAAPPARARRSLRGGRGGVERPEREVLRRVGAPVPGRPSWRRAGPPGRSPPGSRRPSRCPPWACSPGEARSRQQRGAGRAAAPRRSAPPAARHSGLPAAT